MATPTPPLYLIDQLRRMVAEPSQDTYSDAALTAYLTRYPLPDASGYTSDDTAWAGAWDANMVAAEIWTEKAAAFAADYDFTADGGSYKRSQVHQQMLDIARSFRARRRTSALVLKAQPRPESAPSLDEWIGNAPEEDN